MVEREVGASEPALGWYLLGVRARSEKKVALALGSKGFEVFLPTFRSRREWSDRVKEVELPLFPCYLFCRFRRKDQLAVVSTPNVLFGVGSDPHPIPVPDSQLNALKRLLGSGLRVERWRYLKSDQVVRIDRDPLRGVQGVLVDGEDACRVVVNVEPIQAAVAVVIPRELVSAAQRETHP